MVQLLALRPIMYILDPLYIALVDIFKNICAGYFYMILSSNKCWTGNKAKSTLWLL